MRNSLSTEASKPGSVNSRERQYFQSTLARTASAAWRSVIPSANCSTSTMTNRAGEIEGCPRPAKYSANCPSANTSPSASRTRIAKLPLGNAACATRAVSGGTSQPDLGHIDTTDHPTRTQDVHASTQSHRPKDHRSSPCELASRVIPGVTSNLRAAGVELTLDQVLELTVRATRRAA